MSLRRRIQELEREASGEDWWHAAHAAFQLGEVHQEQGDLETARRWYTAALDSDEPDAAPAAAGVLGMLRLDAGEEDSATEVFARALDFRGEATNTAAILLARLRLARDERDAARAALRFAASTDDSACRAEGAARLGLLLEEDGNLWGAALLYEQALATEDPDWGPKAAMRLAYCRAAEGDSTSAAQLLRSLLDAPDSALAAWAALGLGHLLATLDDPESIGAYRRAYDSGHPDVYGEAGCELAQQLLAAGERNEAHAVLQAVVARAEPSWAQEAAERLERIE